MLKCVNKTYFLADQLSVNQLVAGSSPARGANYIYKILFFIFLLFPILWNKMYTNEESRDGCGPIVVLRE